MRDISQKRPIDVALLDMDGTILTSIEAAERAGAMVLVVTATHHRPMEIEHATILDYRNLSLERLLPTA